MRKWQFIIYKFLYCRRYINVTRAKNFMQKIFLIKIYRELESNIQQQEVRS